MPLGDSIEEIQTSDYKCHLKKVFGTRDLNYIIVPPNLLNLKCQKESFLLNHDSGTVSIGVSFIMYMHIFLFLSELSNYVTSFVVGAIAVPFKYIGNKTSIVFTRYKPLIFYILPFVT